MTDIDILLAQALALVNEDQRGELADLIEQIIVAVQATPQKVYLLADGPRLGDLQGVYATREALQADARRRCIRNYNVREFMVETGEAPNG